MLERSTYYILDSQGNQLSMYDHKVTDNAVVYYLSDRNIYGSSRLGSLRDTVNMFIPTNLPSYGFVGNRNYELSNHLGNVLAVVNDIVYPLSDDSTTILSYEVGLSMVSDYSPFGVQLDGRTVENRIYSIKQNCYDSIVVDTSYIANIDFQNGSNGFISENCILFININIYTGERKLSLSKCNIPSPFPGFPSTTQDNKVYLNYTKEDNTTYYYEFDFSIGGCGSIDSVIFFEGLNFDYIQHLTSSGHYSGNFTVDGSGSSQVGFYFAGGSSCSSYLDNFKVYTISNSDTVEICNDVLLENNYLYGFNSMEKDDKIKGEGNSLDFGARMYDPRVGRWLSRDPHEEKYPTVSPYQFAVNSPLIFIDPDGKDNIIYLIDLHDNTDPKLQNVTAQGIANEANKMYEKLGVKTRVVVFDELSMGRFNPDFIDQTDSYAVVGDATRVYDRVGISFTGSALEMANATTGMGVFTERLDKYQSALSTSSLNQTIAFGIVHGSGHNADPAKDKKNHSHFSNSDGDATFMSSGGVVAALLSQDNNGIYFGDHNDMIDPEKVKNGNPNVTSLIDLFNPEANTINITNFEGRFGTNAPKDNYYQNKKSESGENVRWIPKTKYTPRDFK